MGKGEILKLVEEVKSMELNDKNCTEIFISFHEIQSKAKKSFPDFIKLNSRIKKVYEREYRDFQAKHNLYLNKKCAINDLS